MAYQFRHVTDAELAVAIRRIADEAPEWPGESMADFARWCREGIQVEQDGLREQLDAIVALGPGDDWAYRELGRLASKHEVAMWGETSVKPFATIRRDILEADRQVQLKTAAAALPAPDRRKLERKGR